MSPSIERSSAVSISARSIQSGRKRTRARKNLQRTCRDRWRKKKPLAFARGFVGSNCRRPITVEGIGFVAAAVEQASSIQVLPGHWAWLVPVHFEIGRAHV